MHRSKLESYEDILDSLLDESLTVEQIAYETNLSIGLLRRRLDFLSESGLIEERPSSAEDIYAVTERGIAVLKALNFQRYLTKVQHKLRVIDEAMQVVTKHAKDLEGSKE